jgi:hypothetical protein
VTFISISWNFGHPDIVNALAPSALHSKIQKKYGPIADSLFYRQFNFVDGGRTGAMGNLTRVKIFQTPGHS